MYFVLIACIWVLIVFHRVVEFAVIQDKVLIKSDFSFSVNVVLIFTEVFTASAWFNKFKTLERKRYVYKKNNAKFEIDEYSAPEKMYVVAIEGEKEEVDSIYEEVNKLFGSYLI